jgi:hypothetical protein
MPREDLYCNDKEMIGNNMLRLIHMENSWLVTMSLDGRYEGLKNLQYDVISVCVFVNDMVTSKFYEV